MKDIAIIGISCRFPGAGNTTQFWDNLKSGISSVKKFTKEELLEAGEDPDLLNDPNYVLAAPVIDDHDKFDAVFFGISPKEAEMMHPESRVFLECAWEALEDAGYSSNDDKSIIGIYTGGLMHHYFRDNVCANISFSKWSEAIKAFSINEKDYLPTIIADKLNLKGPSINIQSFCSTSLVVVHYACQDLISGMADMAIAGGINIRIPQERGHVYEEGGMNGPYDHCKVFDKDAKGTIFGSGAGLVVLKPLENAVRDRDKIYAVIKGTCVNNDGGNKMSFMGPSISGQADLARKCLQKSKIDPNTISYVEAHGTGTDIGDRIEFKALGKAFREKKEKCPVGSVKTNIGHLGIASGVAGLIKTVLSLYHRQIPPSLNFNEPNPLIGYEKSPFFVNTSLLDWKKNINDPNRAMVCSQGVGGTNACAILEEFPGIEDNKKTRPYQLIRFSANSETALENISKNIFQTIKDENVNIADVAYTLGVGRKQLPYKSFVVGNDRLSILSKLSDKKEVKYSKAEDQPKVVFMFPGQGAQYVNMTKELYDNEIFFRNEFDRSNNILNKYLDTDIKNIIFNSDKSKFGEATDILKQTKYAQPAIFIIEYSLARLWMHWGIIPDAFIGHSIGEFVAACLSKVISLEDALRIISGRAKLMMDLPQGGMMGVYLPVEEIKKVISGDVSIASVNSPNLTVIAGPNESLEKYFRVFQEKEVYCQNLHTSHAFHSHMMEPVVGDFVNLFDGVILNAPEIPIVSTVTGKWASATELKDPYHWGKNLRQAVRFSDALKVLLEETTHVLLEVGPGKNLSTLVKVHKDHSKDRLVLNTTRHANETLSDYEVLFDSVGRLWMKGAKVDWNAFFSEEKRNRISLPTYPFEHQRYWIEHDYEGRPYWAGKKNTAKPEKVQTRYTYTPVWRMAKRAHETMDSEKAKFLVFADDSAFCRSIVKCLIDRGSQVICAYNKKAETQLAKYNFYISDHTESGFLELFKMIDDQELSFNRVLYFWSFGNSLKNITDYLQSTQSGTDDFYTILHIIKSINKNYFEKELSFHIITDKSYQVTGTENMNVLNSLLTGHAKVFPVEYRNYHIGIVDIDSDSHFSSCDFDSITNELYYRPDNNPIAFRSGNRWEQFFSAVDLGKNQDYHFKNSGVYLITGGFGGIGFTVAKYLAEKFKAQLLIIGTRKISERNNWKNILKSSENKEERERINKIIQIEKAGASVHYYGADVADASQMEKISTQIIKDFRHIDGIFHCAGVPGGGIIEMRKKESIEKVLAPKVKGTLNILRNLAEVTNDFIFYFSSIAAAKGIVGQIDYTAANAFLNSIASSVKLIHSKPYVVSVMWDLWTEVGMGVNTSTAGKMQEQRIKDLLTGISPEEGMVFINRILSQQQYANILIANKGLYVNEYAGLAGTSVDVLSAKNGQSGQITKDPDIDNWFYIQSWRRSVTHRGGDARDEKETCLVFAGNSEFEASVFNKLSNDGRKLIKVIPGNEFKMISDNCFSLNIKQEDDYVKLFEYLSSIGSIPSKIIHLWNCSDEHVNFSSIEIFEESQFYGIYSVQHIVKNLLKTKYVEKLGIVLISNGIHKILGNENINPEKATMLGALRVIPLEYPNVQILHIDIDAGSQPIFIENVNDEISTAFEERIIAYRNGRRWSHVFQPVKLRNTYSDSIVVKNNGTYVITGGLDVVGYKVSEFIARFKNVNLVLIGSAYNVKWDKWNSIEEDSVDVADLQDKKIKELRSLGGRVQFYNIDVSDYEATRLVFQEVTKTYGKIDGVFHTMATLDPKAFKITENITYLEFAEHYTYKVRTSYIIEKLLEEYNINTCIFISSVSSILGGIEFLAYSSANNFVDAYVGYLKKRFQHKLISILNIDELKFSRKEEKITRYGKELQRLAINPEELEEVFKRYLSEYVDDQIIVSTGNIHDRINKWLNKSADKEEKEQVLESKSGKHIRPNLHYPYVPPSTEIQTKLVKVWEEVLGYNGIGITDRFFDLGGHSLLATLIVNRIRKDFESSRISLDQILNNLTISELANILTEKPVVTNAGSIDFMDDFINTFPSDRLGFITGYLKKFGNIEDDKLISNKEYLDKLFKQIYVDFKTQIKVESLSNFESAEELGNFLLNEISNSLNSL